MSLIDSFCYKLILSCSPGTASRRSCNIDYLDNTGNCSLLAFSCDICPTGANCASTVPWPQMPAIAGYWRTPYVDSSDLDYNYCVEIDYCSHDDTNAPNNNPQFYRCFNYEFCNGGNNSIYGSTVSSLVTQGSTCSVHREGPLCNICVDGYIESLGGNCNACGSGAGSWVLLVFIVFCLVVALVLMFYVIIE